MESKFHLLAIVILVIVLLHSTLAIRLQLANSREYTKILKDQKLIFFLFHAEKECRQCPKVYVQFLLTARDFEEDTSVIFSTIDIYKDMSLLPILKWHRSNPIPLIRCQFGLKKNDTFTGEYTKVAIESWVKQVKAEIKTLQLEEETQKKRNSEAINIHAPDFTKMVMESTKHVMISIYTPGCREGCKTFDKIAVNFKNEDNIDLLKMDISNAAESQLVSHINIRNNPTLLWFSKDDKRAKIYGGDIDLTMVTEFLNDQTGNFRDKNGELKKNAGRITELDKVIEDNIDDIIVGKNIISTMVKLKLAVKSTPMGEHCVQYYLDILEALNDASNPSTALRSLSDKIAFSRQKGSLSRRESDEMTKKSNVINGFMDMAANQLNERRASETIQLKKSVRFDSRDEL